MRRVKCHIRLRFTYVYRLKCSFVCVCVCKWNSLKQRFFFHISRVFHVTHIYIYIEKKKRKKVERLFYLCNKYFIEPRVSFFSVARLLFRPTFIIEITLSVCGMCWWGVYFSSLIIYTWLLMLFVCWKILKKK